MDIGVSIAFLKPRNPLERHTQAAGNSSQRVSTPLCSMASAACAHRGTLGINKRCPLHQKSWVNLLAKSQSLASVHQDCEDRESKNVKEHSEARTVRK